jgi:HSP20 family protein
MEVERLQRMFDGVFGERGQFAESWTPAVDIYEEADGTLVVKAELAAVKREDIKVSAENQTLTLEAERHVDAGVERDRYHRIERAYGAFRRSFTLPATVDTSRIDASYQDGLLTIRLPRREEARARQIEVK